MPTTTTPAENKVQFNLHNVYYAVYNQSAGTYDTPVHIPGAVSLTLSANGDLQVFNADGIKYWIGAVNNGYSGSAEFAKIPPAMLKDVWGITENNDHVLIESVNDAVKTFALLYQVDGDSLGEFYAFYNVAAKRPALNAGTNEDSKNISTQSFDVECTANNGGLVKASTQASVSDSVRNAWFTSVYTGSTSSGGSGAGGGT